MRQIQLTLSENYVQDWGYWEAIRELLQNGIDREIENKNAKFDFSTNEENLDGEKIQLIFNSKNTYVPHSSLILGNSTKDDGQIGRFGEGYKLAFIVLLRLNCSIIVINQHEEWRVSFKQSRKLNCRLLTIQIVNRPDLKNNKNFLISIGNLPITFHEELKNKYLNLNDYQKSENIDYELLFSEEHIGKVFIGGLFITQFKGGGFKYGYNFKPGKLKLDRDRRLLDTFQFAWALSQSKHSEKRYIFNAIKEGAYDFKYYFTHHSDQNLADSLYLDFKKEYGENAIPTKAGLPELKVQGKKTVYINDTYYDAIVNSPNYKKEMSNIVLIKKKKPIELLEDFIEKYKKDFYDDMLNDFNELIETSEGWVWKDE